MQPDGCISFQSWQAHDLLPNDHRPLSNALARSVLQVKRAGPEVDDPMMGPQDLGPEQSGHGLGTAKQIAMNKTLEIDHANVFTKYVDRADRESPNPGNFHSALL